MLRFGRMLSALTPAGLLVAAVLAWPAASGATPSGSQTVTATVPLDCVLAPGTLNVEATIQATFTGTAAQTVSPGDPLTLTDVTTSLQVPANLSSSFASLGATTASGTVTNFGVDVTNSSMPVVNAAAGGLPFGPVNVVANQALTLPVPSTGPFTLNGGTETGSPGDTSVLSVDTTPGFTGNSNDGFTATGQGITSTVTGKTASGARVGPLSIVCNAPAATLGSVSVVAGASTTTTTTSSSSSSTTTSSTTTSSTTTTSTTTTTSSDIQIPFENWTLSGSVTDTKLGSAISLPPGSTFNGLADLTQHTVTGDISVPAFNSSVNLFGFLPTTVGLTFTEAGSSTGTIITDPSNASDLEIAITSKANLGITSLGAFGLNIPVDCATTRPTVFHLSATLPALDLISGTTFTGDVTLPSVRCRGFLGGLVGGVLTLLFSGPDNPYSLTIAPPPSS